MIATQIKLTNTLAFILLQGVISVLLSSSDGAVQTTSRGYITSVSVNKKSLFNVDKMCPDKMSFADDILEKIIERKVLYLIQISLAFAPIALESTFVRVMASYLIGTKPLS